MLEQLHTLTAHLTQTLPPYIHIHTLHFQGAGQPVIPHVVKENNWEIELSPKTSPSFWNKLSANTLSQC